MDEVLKALADATRRRILDDIQERNGQTLFEICTRLIVKWNLSLTRQAVSKHLAILEAANLVTTERRGRCKFHYLNRAPLDDLYQRWMQKPDNSDPAKEPREAQ